MFANFVSMHGTAEHIILFDGVCNLCSTSVQFVIRHDPKGIFRLAALQSAAGARILKEYGLPPEHFTSIIYIHGGKVYQKSAAALHIARLLGWPWKFLYGLMILPAFLRDFGYNIIARNRYRWFGKKNACMVPTPELQSRFL